MQQLIGSLFGLLGLILLFSFFLQFSGLINLLLSVAIYFGAFMALHYIESLKNLKGNGLKSVVLSFSLFGFVWATSPVLLLTSDFCAYQSESSTQYYSRSSTPKEWFSSGNLTQTDSRVLTKSQTSQCEKNVVKFMLTEQPFLIWIRLLIILLSAWGIFSSLSILWESARAPSSPKPKAAKRQKEKVNADELANKISEVVAAKKYRKARGEIRKIEGWLKDMAGVVVTNEAHSLTVISVSELIEDLRSCYSDEEVTDGMMLRKEKRLTALLQGVNVDSPD